MATEGIVMIYTSPRMQWERSIGGGGAQENNWAKYPPDVSVDSQPESYNMYIIINISY